MAPKCEQSIRYHGEDRDAHDKRDEPDTALRSRVVVDSLKLNRQRIHEREESASKERGIEQVGQDQSVLEQVELYHRTAAHNILVDGKADEETCEAHKTANNTSTRPRHDAYPVHGQNEAQETPGK